MYIILSEYESVWPSIWPQNKCGSLWPIFHGPVIVPYTLKTISCMNIIIWDYESVWPDAWPQNKYRSPWFYVISWRLFDVWTSSLGIMGQYDWTFDLKINVCHFDLYFMVHWFCLISQTIWWMSVILLGNETVWHKLWSQNKYRSTWPILHGLVILLNIFKIIWWMNNWTS